MALLRLLGFTDASTILDLASVLEEAEFYDFARNEFLAVDIVLPVIETDDDQGQYCLHVGEHRFEPNMPYQDYWRPASSWTHAPHHQREVEDRYPQRNDSAWDQLAISSVLRDRHLELAEADREVPLDVIGNTSVMQGVVTARDSLKTS